MTAPRTCRNCGAELTGDVMWCVRCYEPVRHLTPRSPELAVSSPQPIRGDGRARSRWRAGATTFGPVGRIVVTAGVIVFFPWGTIGNPLTLFVYLPAYLVLAVAVLRSTWRRDLATTMPPSTPEPSSSDEPVEVVRPPLPRSTIVAWIALGLIGLGFAIVWTASGDEMHGILGICASLIALVLTFRWFLAA
jgi:hypothetical protein